MLVMFYSQLVGNYFKTVLIFMFIAPSLSRHFLKSKAKFKCTWHPSDRNLKPKTGNLRALSSPLYK